MPQDTKTSLPALSELIAESEKLWERKKLANRKSKTSKTRDKGISVRKNPNVLVVKEVINDERYKVLQGTRAIHHIHVFARLETCHACQESQHTVQRITVVEEDRAGNHYMTTENDINSHAMLEFQRREIPIQLSVSEKIIPACYPCLCAMSLERSRDEKRNT